MAIASNKKRKKISDELKERQYEKEKIIWAVDCVANKVGLEEYTGGIRSSRCMEETDIEEKYLRRLNYIGRKIEYPTFLNFQDKGDSITFFFCRRPSTKCRLGEHGFIKCKEDAKEGTPHCYGDTVKEIEVTWSEIRERFEKERQIPWRQSQINISLLM